LRRLIRLCVLIGIGLAIPYAGFVFLLAWHERTLLYRPIPGPETPQDSGLTGFTRHLQPLTDDVPFVYWEHPAAEPNPIVLFFHGNGGGLHVHASALHQLAALGLHVAALQYPGYPGSPGEPTETRITNHAIALYDVVRHAHPGRPIAVWGYSLGSAVAVQLAARRPTIAVVLESPPTSVVDHTAQRFPLVPVRLLMRDQWRSRDVIASINAPLLILHGEDDGAVPVRHGEALLAHAREPKAMRRFAGFGHGDLGLSRAYDIGAAFLRQPDQPVPR